MLSLYNSTTKSRIINSIIAVSLAVFLSSCARKLTFTQSTVVPAAVGSVKVKKDANKNYAIEVNTTHLAKPESLQPPKNTYVVWMETERNGTKNIGQLISSSGFLSKTLKGSLSTVTSFKPVQFFITAEDNANIQYPGMQVVLTSSKY